MRKSLGWLILTCLGHWASTWQSYTNSSRAYQPPSPSSTCLCGKHFCQDHSTGGSVQFSRSVMSDCLRPHEPQHARPPYPSPTSRVYPNHVHWVGDAIQPSHPLSSPSPPALNLSQHQSLLKWVSSSHQVAKVLEVQLQHRSFQWTSRTDLL